MSWDRDHKIAEARQALRVLALQGIDARTAFREASSCMRRAARDGTPGPWGWYARLVSALVLAARDERRPTVMEARRAHAAHRDGWVMPTPEQLAREAYARACDRVLANELVAGRILPDPPAPHIAPQALPAGTPAHPDDDPRFAGEESRHGGQ